MPAFLSPEWIEQAQKIRAGYDDLAPLPGSEDLRINLLVDDAPQGPQQLHLETGNGGLAIGADLLDAPSATVTMPYDVCRALFVDGNQQVAMQAFMGGKITVEGDMTKLMALANAGGVTPRHQELQGEIASITD